MAAVSVFSDRTNVTILLFPCQVQAISDCNRFEAEIRQEQVEKKKELEEKKQRKAAFKELTSAFK